MAELLFHCEELAETETKLLSAAANGNFLMVESAFGPHVTVWQLERGEKVQSVTAIGFAGSNSFEDCFYVRTEDPNYLTAVDKTTLQTTLTTFPSSTKNIFAVQPELILGSTGSDLLSFSSTGLHRHRLANPYDFEV